MVPLIPFGVAVLTACLLGGTLVLASYQPDGALGPGVVGAWFLLLSFVGLLIARRQPKNPIGWLLQGVALLMSVATFFDLYGWFGVQHRPGSLPGAVAALWLNRWVGTFVLGMFVLIVLLFPTGSYYSPRWRWVGRMAIAASIVEGAVFAFLPGRLDPAPIRTNPLGLEGAEGFLNIAKQAAEFVLVFCAVASIISLVIRFRKSHGVERQQIKWVAYAVAAFPFLYGCAVLVDAILPDQDLDFFFIFGGAFLFPISIAIAMLRYRLYDIDVIVNRTIVYVLLTAIIGGAYLGLVSLMQAVLSSFIDTDSRSDIVIAASTLAAAALFHPLRRRIQEFVDHRFYRRKYDATQVLADFSEKMRQEIDLELLSHELIVAVHQTMHPNHVSLWIRDHHESRA